MELVALGERMRPVLEKHRVQRAVVFGSWARGDATRRSDLDLILVQDTDRRFFDRYDGLLHDLQQALPAWDLDVLIYTAEELGQLAERPLIRTALQEGKVLFERGEEPSRG